MKSSLVKVVDVNDWDDLEIGRVEKVYWAEHASMDAERMKVEKAAEPREVELVEAGLVAACLAAVVVAWTWAVAVEAGWVTGTEAAVAVAKAEKAVVVMVGVTAATRKAAKAEARAAAMWSAVVMAAAVAVERWLWWLFELT